MSTRRLSSPTRSMTLRYARRLIATLKAMSPEQRRHVLAGLPQGLVRAIGEEWWWQAFGGQREPGPLADGSDWRVWAIVAGRGFGKTRAGAEWVWARARENPDGRIALVTASAEEAARVMVEGESGLLEIARSGEDVRWLSSRGELHFSSGARAFAYSAAQPDQLRGPQHHFAWADELAKWPRAEAAWNNLMMGLRLGERPRAVVTTTPRPIPLLKTIVKLARSVATQGRTDQNPHLPADFLEAMAQMYGGTRLGRQELDGVLFDDPEGALWTREMLEMCRKILPCKGRGTVAEGDGGGVSPLRSESTLGGNPHSLMPLRQPCGPPPPLSGEEFVRTVVGLDPPAGASGTCGIVVCGADQAGDLSVLADLSAAGLSPEGWARRTAAAAEAWAAELVVAEKNQGGDMIASVLRGVDAQLPVRLVAATRSKAERAVPVALRFELGRARLAGHFPELEDQLCAFTRQGWGGEGSPDRADAMVWATTELLREKGAPRVRSF